MVSKISQNIMEDVDGVRKNTDIESLLQKYQEKSQKEFIQKYVETKIAVNSYKVTKWSYLFALVAVITASMLSIYPVSFNVNRNSNVFLFLAFFLLLIPTLIILIQELSKKDIPALEMLKTFIQKQKEYNALMNNTKSILFYHSYLQDIIHELKNRGVQC